MRLTGIAFFFLLVQFVHAQQSNELPFIQHLNSKGYYKELLHLIQSDSFEYNPQQKDSVYFYGGWANYSLKNLKESTEFFLKVSTASPFYLKSRFFAGYNQLFLENYKEARIIFDQINIKEEPHSSLLNLELSGLEMLQKDWAKANEQLKKVNQDIASLNKQVIALGQISHAQEFRKSKSPFLAGLMSAVVPGSGKIYAGKTGEGIAAMIATTGFGLITWENWRKLGINNIKTIFFGSIFTATYLSNIYGSALSVKIIENNYQNALHNQILFQLHIPLRNFFE